jgi:hypothetical protein
MHHSLHDLWTIRSAVDQVSDKHDGSLCGTFGGVATQAIEEPMKRFCLAVDISDDINGTFRQ